MVVMEAIVTSIKDPRVVEARLLQTVAGRRSARKCLIEGELAVSWAMKHHAILGFVFIHEQHVDLAVIKQLQERAVPLVVVSDGVMRKIHERSYLIPIVGILRIPPLDHPSTRFIQSTEYVIPSEQLLTKIRTAQVEAGPDKLCTAASTLSVPDL